MRFGQERPDRKFERFTPILDTKNVDPAKTSGLPIPYSLY